MAGHRLTILLLIGAVLVSADAGPVLALQRITEYPIPTSGSYPYDIAPGPDGNVWFTEFSGNKIGRFTTQGVLTEFSIPTANSLPLDITSGPDGALWFTESNIDVSKIGRISTGGAITEYQIPTALSSPSGI